MMIDTHTHFLGESAARLIERQMHGSVPGLPKNLSEGAPIRCVDARLDAMDVAGVGVSVLSPPPFGKIDDQALRIELAKLSNDAVAQVCADHPDRFVMSACLPLPNVDAGVRELERLSDLPFMRAVTVVAQTTTYRPSAIGFDALVASLGNLPMILHPSAGVHDLHAAFAWSGLGSALQAPVSQSLVVADLIATGLFDRYADFSLILTHAGGDLPLVVERFDERLRGDFNLRPSDYVARHMFADTCGLRPGPAYRLALDVFGPERLMLGTDWPSRMIGVHVESLDAMGLAARQWASIASLTASQWFKPDRRSDSAVRIRPS